ncbi:MAG: hypothetical protein ACOCRK_07630 [bacterium]
MDRKLKVLIITSMPWREDNNIGNSYSNIFSGMKDKIEFAHIYCRNGMPQNSFCHKYFQIKESELFKNIKNRKYKPGKMFYLKNPQETELQSFSSIYNKLRILRWEIFFLARNILWGVADWKNKKLDEFVEEFNPDVIFGTLTYMPNINKMMIYLKKKFNIPLVTYAWDDVYSMKQKSFSPFFWIRRITQRKHIRRCVNECDYLYTITDMMQKEYTNYFKKECKLLYKGYDFNGDLDFKNNLSKPIKLVFMGNIGAGRWKSLAKLVSALKNINEKESLAKLFIYTLSPKSAKMEARLNVNGTSKIMDVIPNDEVPSVLKSADVLVHVEPTNTKDRLFYRLSFSTKLVDYFYAGRCILGIGGFTASLDYLKRQDAGIVIKDIKNLEEELKELLCNHEKILLYSKKAWNCGKRNHQINEIQKRLYNDLLSLRS